MAVDEVLFASATAGSAPVLRLYEWSGPWLSLGYAQPFSASRGAACRDAGVHVVRRVTGGRAVLHGRDLTYGVAPRRRRRAVPGGRARARRQPRHGALPDAPASAGTPRAALASRSRLGRMRKRWRLLVEATPATGWWNMAVDEALLASAAPGRRRCCASTSGADPGSRSATRSPSPRALDAACRGAGVRVVRRVTGGRAVLHGADLTYGVAAPAARCPPDSSPRIACSRTRSSPRSANSASKPNAPPPRTRSRPRPTSTASRSPRPTRSVPVVASSPAARSAALRAPCSSTARFASSPIPPRPPRPSVSGAARRACWSWGLRPPPPGRRWRSALPAALGRLLGVRFEADALQSDERRAAEERALRLQRDPLGRRAAGTLSASRARC